MMIYHWWWWRWWWRRRWWILLCTYVDTVIFTSALPTLKRSVSCKTAFITLLWIIHIGIISYFIFVGSKFYQSLGHQDVSSGRVLHEDFHNLIYIIFLLFLAVVYKSSQTKILIELRSFHIFTS
jgi:hypothetical protein